MLSLPRLVILAQLGQHERLIDAVLRNGRPLPVPLRARLADEHNAPIASLALAVQRYLELAARPTIPLRDLLDQMLTTLETTQPTTTNLPAQTLALAALTEAEQIFQPTVGGLASRGGLPEVARHFMPPEQPSSNPPDTLLPRLHQARATLWHNLACAQSLDPDADLPLGTIADPHTTHLLLWQLNRLPDAADHLHLPLLIDAAFTLNLTADPRIATTLSTFDIPEPVAQPSTPEHHREQHTEPVAA